MQYGVIKDGKLEYVENSRVIDGKFYAQMSHALHLRLGEKPVRKDKSPKRPPCKGWHWEQDGWRDTPNAIMPKWKAARDSATPLSAYDEAMEAHLRKEREERGYTTREPDAYLSSSVPRWAQDARDWVAHRDAVMAYALEIINEVESGQRKLPTVEEFVAGLPNIVWTYSDASEEVVANN